MRTSVELVRLLNLLLFVAIAFAAVRHWRANRGSRVGLWAAVAFVALAWVVVVGRLLPDEPEPLWAQALQRTNLALLLLFPYFVYRFATAFDESPRPLARFVDVLSSALVVATFALPSIPGGEEPWPWWFGLYIVALLLHWAVLLTLVAVRLWRASRAEASVTRRRMRLLAFASVAIVVALFLAVAGFDPGSWPALAVALVVTMSGLAFLLGFAPPPGLRLLWRRPEQARMQAAIGELLVAGDEADVARRVLPPLASMVGAQGIALEDAAGRRIGEHGDLGAAGREARFEFPYGRLLVHESPFAPFFGDEERKLLNAVGSLIGIALDRARLFMQEREAREALEQADRLKSEFVALAAHELRSPVGAIYGISETIASRGAELEAPKLVELQSTLTDQIRRLRELVDQLLDLSRLDAQAVTISPTRVRVRERLEEIVLAASPLDAGSIGIDADPQLEAMVDPDALERIVSNLVVNACRYGAPPVRVSATSTGGTLRVVVEDEGPGVPAEFVPQLFERFARSAASAGTVSGTGLGLAIAESYARAHEGALVYRPRQSHGAAFELVLPAAAG